MTKSKQGSKSPTKQETQHKPQTLSAKWLKDSVKKEYVSGNV